jgi:capsule polysaccharide export protein KpsE/RkpR
MSLLSSAGPAASVGSAALGMKTPGALFSGILGSRAVQESLVRRFDLVRYYKVHFVEDARKHLAADSHIVENTKTGIISVSVTAKNPVLASNIAQGYVAELDRVVTNNSTSAARRERIFLEERLKEIKKDLDDSAKALVSFLRKTKRSMFLPKEKQWWSQGLSCKTSW